MSEPKQSKKTKKVPKKITVQKPEILVLGHRGNSGYLPENSIKAFKSCIDLPGVAGAEIDVQMTRDGEVIVYHDEDLTRFGGPKAKIPTTSWPEIKKIDIGTYYGTEYTGTTIPLLDDLMGLLPQENPDFLLNIELKISPVLKGENLKTFVNRLYTQVDSWIDPNKILFSSFNWDCLDMLRHFSQEMRLGVLTDQPDERGWISKVKQLNAEFLIVPMSKVDQEFVSLVKEELEAGIIAYTEFDYKLKDEELEMASQLIKLDIRGLIVNYPQDVHRLLE
ncbi:MAG: hypothetical protein L6Q77_04145 [Bacteroidetes bacterium]|nr:hypothetical protein [Bacteroidota bacterium]